MRILRYDVPIDDNQHEIVCGSVVHVDCRTHTAVTFWADDFQPHAQTFQVFGTGHEIPEDWLPIGTALSPSTRVPGDRGRFVWHLLKLGAP